jgi:hypothetical protein
VKLLRKSVGKLYFGKLIYSFMTRSVFDRKMDLTTERGVIRNSENVRIIEFINWFDRYPNRRPIQLLNHKPKDNETMKFINAANTLLTARTLKAFIRVANADRVPDKPIISTDKGRSINTSLIFSAFMIPIMKGRKISNTIKVATDVIKTFLKLSLTRE